jgi:hypothetical protein
LRATGVAGIRVLVRWAAQFGPADEIGGLDSMVLKRVLVRIRRLFRVVSTKV